MGSVPRMYSAVGVRAARIMPKCVRNSSAASRSGDRSRPYARSLTLITAMPLPPGFPTPSRAQRAHERREVGEDRIRTREVRLEVLMPAIDPRRLQSEMRRGRQIDDLRLEDVQHLGTGRQAQPAKCRLEDAAIGLVDADVFGGDDVCE